MLNLNNKKILITGHTGFKGTYLAKTLLMMGANVSGYSLKAKRGDLYLKTKIKNEINEKIADIRDINTLNSFVKKIKPDYIIHLAAQPLVRDAYKNPRYTYETNVMGTINILECVRKNSSVSSFLNVTTDKVYENNGLIKHAFKEDEKLDGYDPYSNSKSCSEIVTHSYKKSFLRDIAISTARAGNVLGGGDNAKDRIIPDCVRASIKGEDIIIRNPHSIRPYQYVMEPILAYIDIVYEQSKDISKEGYYNIGPEKISCIQTIEIVKKFCNYWNTTTFDKKNKITKQARYKIQIDNNAPHEAGLLMLDNNKIKKILNIKPRLSIDDTIKRTIEFYQRMNLGENIDKLLEEDIKTLL
ncbi:MAG: CDP-glucose 4,6-dehydratase [Eubacteriales bacterium]|nr:CDP-glucose 4,6-dehydratase [Eubacteriales bacterium]